jgi:hypothetical protein
MRHFFISKTKPYQYGFNPQYRPFPFKVVEILSDDYDAGINSDYLANKSKKASCGIGL